MPTLLQSILEEFRNKFGNYGLYKDMEYATPKFQDASAEVEAFLTSSLSRLGREVVAAVEERKEYEMGQFLEHRREFNKGFNSCRESVIKALKDNGVETEI